MASTKNVQALNNRLDLACRNRIDEFYRQHVSSLAQLEHQKLDTARLLKSVKKCPSDHEALSIKFLGPAPKSGRHRHGRQPLVQDQTNPGEEASQLDKKGFQSARPSPTPPEPADSSGINEQVMQYRRQQTANPFAVGSGDSAVAVAKAERAKTFADGEKPADDDVSSRRRRRRSRSKRRRARTPLPSKLERFYAQLNDTKRGCGLPVIDATQTAEAHQFCLTLSRTEWRVRLAKIDPEYFKNSHINSDSESEGDAAGSSSDDSESGN